MIVTASAPAKIILFGEHFVVYGEPAVATAIDRRAQVTAQKRNDKRIFIDSLDLGASGFFTKNRFQAEQGGSATQAKLEPTHIAVQRTLDRCGKETGAGRGGCMIALCSPDKLKRIVDAIESQGGTAFVARKTDEGVRIED